MKEDLLHYIWQQKVLFKNKLQTTSGKPIEVIKPGLLNTNAGPDFFDARIRINNTLWAGNVEIHLKSSDWIKHKHHIDDAYKNVILHVVFEHDAELGLPTLELKNHISPEFLKQYDYLQQVSSKVPCEQLLKLPEEIKLNQFLHRLSIERLEQKCTHLEQQLYSYGNSWEKLFYVVMAKYFGMNVNAEPFIQLAESLPAQLLAKHKHNQLQINALIFGVAGFLPAKSNNEHIIHLTKEFEFLRAKYQLKQLPASMWKFAKTRPANFPTVRLIQFAALVFHSTHLFSKLMLSENIKQALTLLRIQVDESIDLNEFHHANHTDNPIMGTQFLTHLLINAVIPVKFLYGKHTLNETLCEQAISWLEQLNTENNTIVRFWRNNGIKANHALHSQALIQLNSHYCAYHKCLNCTIGNHILYQHA